MQDLNAVELKQVKMVRNNKVAIVKDGKVAVLISPGLGSGFSTEIDEDDYPGIREQAAFHPRLVRWVEGGKKEDIGEIVKTLWGDMSLNLSGLLNLRVEWIPIGTQFTIENYDGAESINYNVYTA